jgi:uncharacterized membrane protein YkvA (DUF1232 family)
MSDQTFAGDGDDARTVRQRFWEKARRTVGLVPFLDEAVAAFYCAIDPATPSWVKGTLFGALAYFILPFDFVPDVLPLLGFTDDAAVLATAIRMVASHITQEHRDAARAALKRGLDTAEANES